MRGWGNRWASPSAALAAAVIIGGCGNLGTLASATTPQKGLSPLVRSIEAYVHAISVQSIHCGPAGSHGRKSCEVEFTDAYGQWYATLVARGSRIIADPGGVSDWLCNGACANPPAMTGNTGKKGFNTGTGNTAPTGPSGPTGTGATGAAGNGVVKGSGNGVVKGTGSGVVHGSGTGSGVVQGSGTGSGVVQGSGTGSGVVQGSGTGSGVVQGSGTGSTGTLPPANKNGVVYGTGSTGPGAPGATGR